jgi:hypothetical protein
MMWLELRRAGKLWKTPELNGLDGLNRRPVRSFRGDFASSRPYWKLITAPNHLKDFTS